MYASKHIFSEEDFLPLLVGESLREGENREYNGVIIDGDNIKMEITPNEG